MPRNKKKGRSLKKFRNRAEKKARRFREEAKQLDSTGKKRPVDYIINKDVVYNRAEEDFNNLLVRYDYQLGFPGAVNDESTAIHGKGVGEDESRLDLRGDFVITIDGETAKDFDDAISLSFRDGIYHLGVHIADVSHYVEKDSKLDKIAARRGTSVYLIDHVIPMLPEVLSNDLCSLVEGKPRLTFSCLMDIDESGRCLRTTFKKSVIQSRRRTTYTEVQKILDGKLDLGEEFRNKVVLFNQLKQILFRKRIREGAINLESDELF
ncbi:MAG: RNB domain-containing ribonuclease, partial [Spirochaetia bacterium]|nr:RNB domain-containing ribonuclease [Spirochaetia bacterium]